MWKQLQNYNGHDLVGTFAAPCWPTCKLHMRPMLHFSDSMSRLCKIEYLGQVWETTYLEQTVDFKYRQLGTR